ncbi:MAG: hypothetical protein K6B44_04960 [Lachnospiraceae bacterium]|nr:hypothetical protein [Lachnospiraceae bacterium]
MMDGYEYIDDSWNFIFLEDVEIAKKEIRGMKLVYCVNYMPYRLIIIRLTML